MSQGRLKRSPKEIFLSQIRSKSHPNVQRPYSVTLARITREIYEDQKTQLT